MFIAKELLRLVNDEEGLTIVEYAVAGGLVTIGAVAAFVSLGDAVETNINELCGAVNGPADGETTITACNGD
ncbi:Flp family type IVb pilin [Oceanimonas smirnovii]|uniref:Flp family type IVb pilin n=1 Tax=Oceanimonas smirnovii TaxID=264574 RepID=UPI003FD18E84